MEPTEQPATTEKTFAGFTNSQRDALRAQYGEGRVSGLEVKLPSGKLLEWAYRAPERMEYERFMETAAKLRDGKAAQALGANRTLVLACTLGPDNERMTAVLDSFPMLVLQLSEPILKMAGADVEVREITF